VARAQEQSAKLMGDSEVNVFDRVLKAQQRDRSAVILGAVRGGEPVSMEVASGLIDRLGDVKRSFPTVLNVGGAGAVMAEHLSRTGMGVRTMIQTDISLGQLAYTREHLARGGGLSGMSMLQVQAEEEFLPVKEGSCDAVISCLGLHWVNDLPGAMVQCRKALKPDGLFLGAMLGGESLKELRIACLVAEQERDGGVSSRVSPLAQVSDAGNLLTRAGLVLTSVDVDTITVHYPSAVELVGHLRAMGEGNATNIRALGVKRDTAMAAAAVYQSMFGKEDGTVPATFQVIYMIGWAPDPSQPRSKRRGSATVSISDLADALEKNAPKEEGGGK